MFNFRTVILLLSLDLVLPGDKSHFLITSSFALPNPHHTTSPSTHQYYLLHPWFCSSRAQYPPKMEYPAKTEGFFFGTPTHTLTDRIDNLEITGKALLRSRLNFILKYYVHVTDKLKTKFEYSGAKQRQSFAEISRLSMSISIRVPVCVSCVFEMSKISTKLRPTSGMSESKECQPQVPMLHFKYK